MYMFNTNWRYNQPIIAPIVAQIHIQHAHFSVSYQWAIYQKYDRCGQASPGGYGAIFDAAVLALHGPQAMSIH